MKVLIVDDEPAIRSSIRRVLVREYGADVDGVGDGCEALARLMQRQYDLVLLDIHMPEMDGLQTLRAIRRSQNRSAIPVVMLTGASDEYSVREAKSLGVSEYLLKPVQAESLVLRLAEVLARPVKSGSGPSTAGEPLTLGPRDRLLLIEPNAAIAAFVTARLAKFCQVMSEPSPTVALAACVAAPPTAVILGGDDAVADALFLAKIRNDPHARGVPVFALVPPGHMSHALQQLAVDGALPRTQDESAWAAAEARAFRKQADGVHYLEHAFEGTTRFLSSLLRNPVVKLAEPGPPRLRRWLSSRIAFVVRGQQWRLTIFITYPSVTRLATVTAPSHLGVSEGDVEATLDALGHTIAAQVAGEADAEPLVTIGATHTCSEAPPPDSGAGDEQWVMAPGHDILLFQRATALP